VNTARIRRHLPALGLILLLALATRLTWLAFVHPNPNDGRFDDTVWYRNAAHFVALGYGYVNPYSATPTAQWPPGYPVFLGAVFKAFGEGLAQAYAANVVLATITALIVYAIGLVLFDRRVALVGAAAVALWPGQVFFASLVMSEVLFTALFTLALLLVLVMPRAGAWRGALVVAFGIVVTAAALTRGQALMLLAVAPLAWGLSGLSWRRAIGWGILAAAVTGVLLAPWVLRNQRELDSPVIIATNFGGNLWLGNHAGSTGRMQSNEPIPLPDRTGLTQQEYEVNSDRLQLRKALDYIKGHPLDEFRLAGLKTRALYESDATGLDWNSAYDNSFYPGSWETWLRNLANGFWFAALAFAGIGLVAERQRLRGPLAVLPLTLLLWTALHMVFFGDSRFHYPVVFVVALLGARGLVAVFELIARREPTLRRRYAAA
jgi:4-amino-4-deoxy-L-arabinose transferase-like glycosyltransferase